MFACLVIKLLQELLRNPSYVDRSNNFKLPKSPPKLLLSYQCCTRKIMFVHWSIINHKVCLYYSCIS